jgi:hypothetical protein
MDDQTHTFRLVESRASLAGFWFLQAIMLFGIWLFPLLDGNAHGKAPIGFALFVMLLVILFNLRSMINVVLRPTLIIAPQGITWQRRVLRPLFMPWGQITRMWTGATTRNAEWPRPEVYYIVVQTLTGRLRIGEGVVNDVPDLDVIGRVIDEVSMRFGTGLRIEDRAELMGPWKESREG